MTNAIFSGLLLGMALVFSVGPVIFTIIKLRINYGLASAFYFISGVWISDLIWVFTANLFGDFIEELSNHKTAIGICGGIFLMALGVFYLFIKKYHSKEDVDGGVKIGGSTYAKLFITGFLINTLNPGVITLWFAAAAKSIGNPMNERMMTFAICLGLNMSADILKINLAGKLRRKLTEKNINIINKISGVLFIVFGVLLILGLFYSKVKNQ